jgi:hypothetical protein
MTSGEYSEVRTTSVSILTANGNVTSSQWTLTTIPDKTPVIRLSSSVAQVPYGGELILSWESEYATSVSSNFGVGSGQTTGSILLSGITQSKIYTITAYGPDGGSRPSSVTIPIQTITTAQITASPTTIPYEGNVAISWSTQNANYVRSNFGAVEPSGQVVIEGVTQRTTYTVVGVGPSGDSPEASVTVSTEACQVSVQNLPIDSGVNATSKLGEDGQYYFTSLDGSNINNSMKSGSTSSGNVADFTTPGTYSWIVPSGVTSVLVLCIGGGGGGGSDSGTETDGGGGGGGGGIKRGTIGVNAGQTLIINVGSGGAGAIGGSKGQAEIGESGQTSSCGTVSASGGGGGGRSTSGLGGSDNGGAGQTKTSSTNARGGFGGGAGLIDGTNAGSADGTDSCTSCGGPGGNGASLTGAVGSLGVARSGGKLTGGDGGNYGGGGGGGSKGNRGGKGGNGAVRITYTSSSIGGDSWNNVALNIRSTFISRSGRPPTITELRYWLNEYKNSTTLTLQQLINNISNNLTTNKGSVKDNCGNTIN